MVSVSQTQRTASKVFLESPAGQLLLIAFIVALPICLGWFYHWAAENAPWLATIILVLGAILIVLWAYRVFTSD